MKQFPLGGEPVSDGAGSSIQPSMAEKLKVKKTMAGNVRKKHLLPLLFVQPRNAQKFVRIGRITFRLQGADSEKELVFQLEFKEFGSKAFKKVNLRSTSLTSGSGQVSGKFKVTNEGEYRIRVRRSDQDSSWSNWVKFTVGDPKIKKSLSQTDKLKKKQLSQKKSVKQVKSQKTSIKKPVKQVSTKKKNFQMK